jgi:hypothetical protein
MKKPVRAAIEQRSLAQLMISFRNSTKHVNRGRENLTSALCCGRLTLTSIHLRSILKLAAGLGHENWAKCDPVAATLRFIVKGRPSRPRCSRQFSFSLPNRHRSFPIIEQPIETLNNNIKRPRPVAQLAVYSKLPQHVAKTNLQKIVQGIITEFSEKPSRKIPERKETE